MKHIYLHIGVPKTGTTAIQEFFFANKALLEKNGVGFFMPESDDWRQQRANASLLLDYILTGAKKGQNKLDSTPAVFSGNNSVFASYAADFSKLILSDEMFWPIGARRKDLWTLTRDCLISCLGDCAIHPIVYLRRQDELIQSLWKEWMSKPLINPLTFDEALNNKTVLSELNFFDRLNEIESVFGKDLLTVRVYDRNRFPHGNACYDFMSSINVPWSEGYLVEKNVHESITLDAAEAMNLINRGIVVYETEGSWRPKLCSAVKAFSKMFPEQVATHRMNANERKDYLAQFHDSNVRTSRKYLGINTLFDETIPEYKVWVENRKRDIENAEFIIKLSTAGIPANEWIKKYLSARKNDAR